MSTRSAPRAPRSEKRPSRRPSPYRIALHDALVRNLAGLGFDILHVLYAHNCALSSTLSGHPVREMVLDGVESIAGDIVSGTMPASVAELHALPKDEDDGLCATLERLISTIADAQRVKSADAPPGSRWPKATLLPVIELLPEITAEEREELLALPHQPIPLSQDRDDEELRRLLERELWRRLNRTQSEAWHVATKHRQEHLDTLPKTVRRIVAQELNGIVMTTTGEHVVDRIASGQRTCVPVGA